MLRNDRERSVYGTRYVVYQLYGENAWVSRMISSIYQIVVPPSKTTILPVMKEEALDAR